MDNGIDSVTLTDVKSAKSVSLTRVDAKDTRNAIDHLDDVGETITPEPEPKYVPAPEVQEVAARLISHEVGFSHLAEARIAYLFRTNEWESKGFTVMGRAYVNDDRKKVQTEKDLEVVVNRFVWEHATSHQREALVAHELCHFME